MTANLELVRRTYEGSSEENGRNLLAARDDAICGYSDGADGSGL